MIARTLTARLLLRPLLLLLPLCLVVASAGCKKKKPKPFPPAPALVADAGVGAAVPMMTATPSSLAAPADTMRPPDRAAFEQTKDAVRVLQDMVKRGSTTNPDKPEEDAASKCAVVEENRARVEALADNDAKDLAVESKRLCSLEVPILDADHALKQVTISPSQASHQLMCKYASKAIETARAAKSGDRRVRDLDARYTRSCR